MSTISDAPIAAVNRDRLDVPDVVSRLRRVVQTDAPVALHEPTFGGREWEYVKDCLDTGWVSSVGKYVDRFETMVAEACGAKHAVAVVNGTGALHMALLASGAQRDDEVLVPALTFIATANAVSYIGATAHFIDVEESTMGVDAAALDAYLRQIAERTGGEARNRETGRRISAIVPMHAFGTPVDMDALARVATNWNIAVVEDAAEAIGASYRGRRAGSLATVAAVSFNGNKIVTTGGGGAVVTNDADIARRIKHLTTQAKKPHRWEFDHDEIGYNYRLPNINAALGCAQLERLDEFVEKKRRLASRYHDAFGSVAGLRPHREPIGSTSNYWLNALVLDESCAGQRDELLAATNEAGLMTRPIWKLMSRLSIYAGNPRAPLPVAESLERRIVNVPSSPGLADGA